MSTTLSTAQRRLFWRALGAACNNQGITSHAAIEAYRKHVISTETAHTSLTALNRTSDFDAVMIRLAHDAADYELAVRFSSGTERRIAYMVEICAMQLIQLYTEQPDALAYVIGIINQAGYRGNFNGSTWWLDLTTTELYALFQMLDTHRRRILKQLPYEIPLKFAIGMAYWIDASQHVHMQSHAYPPTSLQIRVA